jgi:hypothetical protein
VHCTIVRCLWVWIVSYNNFSFNCNSIDDLWQINAYFPYKVNNICEILKGAVLWVIWNERNRLIFKGGNCKTVRTLGNNIIMLAKYWSQIKGKIV